MDKDQEKPTSGDGGVPPITEARLGSAEKRLGYKFKNRALLAQALSHASTRNEGFESNERLEFLGDSVLNMLISWFLYDGLPQANEGELSHRRSLIAQGEFLARVGRRLKLSELLRTGKGQDLEPTANMEADLVEACIGAIFLDGGLEAAQDFVLLHVISHYEPTEKAYTDPKSRLQHYTLEHRLGLPAYELVETSGPAHALTFEMLVKVEDEEFGRGRGSSKKIAARIAASEALDRLMAGQATTKTVTEEPNEPKKVTKPAAKKKTAKKAPAKKAAAKKTTAKKASPKKAAPKKAAPGKKTAKRKKPGKQGEASE